MKQVAHWLLYNTAPRTVTSDKLLYDQMESQSDRGLPLIYLPFDAAKRWHWTDRGSILDFWACVGDGDILDFGPGDGWPSLPLAPMVRSVTGVDASARRVGVCAENAARMGLTNASFVLADPARALPFADCSFDGITAASSVEQSPDPAAVLREFHRVLRPGGRVRIDYEALGRYRGAEENEVIIRRLEPGYTMLLATDRDIAGERALYCSLRLPMAYEDAQRLLGTERGRVTMITEDMLHRLRALAVDAMTMELRHPSGATLARWLREAGFGLVRTTQSGSEYAGLAYDRRSESERPTDLAGVDAILKHGIAAVTKMEAPIEMDAPIIAVR